MSTYKQHLCLSIAIVAVLTISFALFTQQWVFSEQDTSPMEDRVTLKSDELTSTATYFVTVGNEVVFESNEFSSSAASEHCEEVAYANENYFKQVTCVFAGEERYNDVFIPG